MIRYAVLLLALAACGKSSTAAEPSSPSQAASPAADPGAPANKTADRPAAPPVKAPARGAEHAVYSLADNRLVAHLERGGALVVPAGSAGFAKYTRIGNVMKGTKRAW